MGVAYFKVNLCCCYFIVLPRCPGGGAKLQFGQQQQQQQQQQQKPQAAQRELANHRACARAVRLQDPLQPQSVSSSNAMYDNLSLTSRIKKPAIAGPEFDIHQLSCAPAPLNRHAGRGSGRRPGAPGGNSRPAPLHGTSIGWATPSVLLRRRRCRSCGRSWRPSS